MWLSITTNTEVDEWRGYEEQNDIHDRWRDAAVEA